jgi:molybdate transport system permease protein
MDLDEGGKPVDGSAIADASMKTSEWLEPVALSLQVTLAASIFVFAAGTAAAWLMSRASFRGKTLLETALMLPLVLPPTVVGFLLLLALGRRSWLGMLAEKLFASPIVFTWQAAVVASIVVAFPLVYQTVKVGLAAIDRDLLDSARSLGASEWQLLRYITLPLARYALRTAYILGFARALGEFGATMMVAGNIPGRTQTAPTAIYIAVERGDMPLAWLLTGIIIAISYALLLLVPRDSAKNPSDGS